jgi:hypothetical protein
MFFSCRRSRLESLSSENSKTHFHQARYSEGFDTRRIKDLSDAGMTGPSQWAEGDNSPFRRSGPAQQARCAGCRNYAGGRHFDGCHESTRYKEEVVRRDTCVLDRNREGASRTRRGEGEGRSSRIREKSPQPKMLPTPNTRCTEKPLRRPEKRPGRSSYKLKQQHKNLRN